MLGNSSSAKSARVKKQLRDKNGRWIEMGGLVKYSNGSNTFVGEVVDIPDYATDEMVSIKVTSNDNEYFNKIVDVESKYLETVKAKADLDITTPVQDTPVAPEPEVKKSAKKYGDVHTEISSKYTVKDSAFKNFPGYTYMEEMALSGYAYEYDSINTPLRTYSEQAIASMKKGPDYTSLMSVLDKSPLAEPVTVWRGLRASPELLKKMQKNNVYYDKAFTSTSSNGKVALDTLNGALIVQSGHKPVVLEIRLPAGFKAHKFDYTMNDSNRIERFADEEEVLLPPDVLFRVISMEPSENGSGYRAVIEPVLTSANSVGIKTDDESAKKAMEEAQKKSKKWGLFNSSAEDLDIHSKLISSNGIILEKISAELWVYKTATNEISYNNRSVDCLKSIDAIEFNVETD